MDQDILIQKSFYKSPALVFPICGAGNEVLFKVNLKLVLYDASENQSHQSNNILQIVKYICEMFIIAENNEENAPKYQGHMGKFLNLQDLYETSSLIILAHTLGVYKDFLLYGAAGSLDKSVPRSVDHHPLLSQNEAPCPDVTKISRISDVQILVSLSAPNIPISEQKFIYPGLFLQDHQE